jgi:ABC-type dipeptide/oligopeptide/nickel transport system ATPase subunit
MNIIELRAENIKNLKAIRIKPDGAVILEGKNGAGKSAVLDSIFMALTGKKIAEPIRNGEKKAEINVDLGTYRVKKVFTAKGERLEVMSKEGVPFKSPQTMLNEILGNLSFDPLGFAEMGKTTEGMRKQRGMLAALVGLDFSELDKRRTDLYNERTVKNREIKGSDPGAYRDDPYDPLPLESLISTMPVPAPGTPRQEVSMAEEIKKIEELERKAADHEDFESEVRIKRQRIDANCEDMSEMAREMEHLTARMKVLQDESAKKVAENAEIQKVIDAQVEPENVTPEQISEARKALLNIEEKNKAIRDAIEYDKKVKQLEEARKVVERIEDQMMKIDLEKDNRMKAAVFPIEGLGLTDEYITFAGKPFSQLSTGEQIRVSTAVAMALNPTLKVILVREGSLLDKKGLAEIVALAKDKDYQLWVERVADDKQVGIYLEDGEIV